ncbi:MAG: shikimate kinase [Bacteroidota bacterium]
MNSLNSNESKQTGLIFLIGFMGCGKTTLGKKLASRMGYPFIDLDHVLEAKAGMTIAEYFSTHGEGSFRKLESEILKQTDYPENAIISTGGGLPCFFDNMDWINAHGRSIYIQLPPKTLAQRLSNEKNQRPLLREKQGEELIAFIEQKLNEREIYYKQAGIVADGLGLNAERAEEMIKAAH